MEDLHSLQKKVDQYKSFLNNTIEYRKMWEDKLKDFIMTRLEEISTAVGLNVKIDHRDQIENLETIILSLGAKESGIYEKVNETTQKALIKNNGALVYQQLFNGKIQVMIGYPHIEGFGEPQPPKMIAIYRPSELKIPFIIRHMEEFIKEIGKWEDFDDDEPQPAQRIGFNVQNLVTAPQES